MKKRQFGTLLAVTLAAAAPATASPHRAAAPPARPTLPPAPAPAPPAPPTTPVAGPAAPSFVQHLVHAFATLARTAARPRELPCGAPACGNVMSRTGPRPPRSE